jgi:hypothetical protein
VGYQDLEVVGSNPIRFSGSVGSTVEREISRKGVSHGNDMSAEIPRKRPAGPEFVAYRLPRNATNDTHVRPAAFAVPNATISRNVQ